MLLVFRRPEAKVQSRHDKDPVEKVERTGLGVGVERLQDPAAEVKGSGLQELRDLSGCRVQGGVVDEDVGRVLRYMGARRSAKIRKFQTLRMSVRTPPRKHQIL